jgi:hypothetical protein
VEGDCWQTGSHLLICPPPVHSNTIAGLTPVSHYCPCSRSIEQNTAATTGGGAHAEKLAFASNDVDTGGTLVDSPVLSIAATAIVANAAAAGGGIFADESAIYVLPTSSILRNQALGSDISSCLGVRSGAGGGIYVQMSMLILAHATLRSNWARFEGGGLRVDETSQDAPGLRRLGLTRQVTAESCDWSSNAAPFGGALCISGGIMSLEGGTMSDNGHADGSLAQDVSQVPSAYICKCTWHCAHPPLLYPV